MDKTFKEIMGDKWDKMLRLKCQSIDPYVKDFRCPECNNLDTNHVVGWCDAGNLGLMMINECPKCGTRYRFHGTTTGRWNLDTFIGDLYAQLSIQK